MKLKISPLGYSETPMGLSASDFTFLASAYEGG